MEWMIKGRGHENIKATHRTTLEFTKEKDLSPRGDCIVAVACDNASRDAPEWLRKLLLRGEKIKITITCGNANDWLVAEGNKNLLLSHPTDIVIRKSSHIDTRTLAVKASKAARDLKRILVSELRKGKPVKIKITPYQ